MRVITEGYDYEVINKGNANITQLLHFYQHTIDGVHQLKRDGITNEELLKVLIHRYEYLNKNVPDAHNVMIITLLKSCLEHQKTRTEERKQQGIEGTLKETIMTNKTNYP